MIKNDTILLVGDEDLFVELLGRLTPPRFSLIYSSNISEAQAQLNKHSPTVVVIDFDSGGPELRDLVGLVRGKLDTICIAITSSSVDEVTSDLCHAVVENDVEKIVEVIDQHLAMETPKATKTEKAPKKEPEVARRLEDVTNRLKELERHLGDVALGATGGLTELLEATDGLAQGFKAQARTLSDLEQRLQEDSSKDDRVDQSPATIANEAAEKRIEVVLERLGNLEDRLSDIAVGTTGGLTELLQTTDGLSQWLKGHANLLGDLEKRLHDVSARQIEWQAKVDAARKAPEVAEGAADKTLEQQLAALSDRVESLEARVGEVALGTTEGLTELLQTTDGLGQWLKGQARVMNMVQHKLQETQDWKIQWQAVIEALANRLKNLEQQ